MKAEGRDDSKQGFVLGKRKRRSLVMKNQLLSNMARTLDYGTTPSRQPFQTYCPIIRLIIPMIMVVYWLLASVIQQCHDHRFKCHIVAFGFSKYSSFNSFSFFYDFLFSVVSSLSAKGISNLAGVLSSYPFLGFFGYLLNYAWVLGSWFATCVVVNTSKSLKSSLDAGSAEEAEQPIPNSSR
ncbi:unnamed protein product [Citrullus colocynthis]|uniref:Uncharacterized protein n=1 Tax=Citrullus colocynthis TaxID=252529 RepID=A0ABP0Y3J4_9ROSI